MSAPTTVAELHADTMLRIQLITIACKAMLVQIEGQSARIGKLEAQNGKQSARIAELENQVGKLVAPF